MSESSIRDAIVGYLREPAIPGLYRVWRGQPVTIVGDDWPIGVDTNWGATAYVHFNEQGERRIAYGGAPPSGIKRVRYNTALVVMFRWGYANHDAENTTDQWVEPFDTLMGNIKARMRADRTFGCGANGPIWQAGEGDQGDDDDIRQINDLPRVDEGQLIIWTALEFTVIEMVTAPDWS